MVKLYIMLAVIAIANAAPGNVNFQASAVADVDGLKPPITLDAGNVGVNFAGYHASAGLGGLLTGDPSMGGLHAEAGTPFGQEAGAGLGGTVDANGKAGAVYAGAAAGGGIGAAAGIAGGGEYGHKTFHQQAQVISEKSFQSAPKVISEHTYQEAPVVHRTVIEKTVIPQYIEKTIQVPSYVEKTIRVPTVVEHKVRVPVTPKVVEKTYNEDAVGIQKQVYIAPHHQAAISTNFNAGAYGGAGIGVEKVKLIERRPIGVRKHIYGRPGLLGGLFGSFGGGGGYGGQAVGTSYGQGVGSGATGGAAYAYKANSNPQLFNDIFNIPISALGAVNNLLNGIVGGGQSQAGASLSFNKQISVGGGAAGAAGARTY